MKGSPSPRGQPAPATPGLHDLLESLRRLEQPAAARRAGRLSDGSQPALLERQAELGPQRYPAQRTTASEVGEGFALHAPDGILLRGVNLAHTRPSSEGIV